MILKRAASTPTTDPALPDLSPRIHERIAFATPDLMSTQNKRPRMRTRTNSISSMSSTLSKSFPLFWKGGKRSRSLQSAKAGITEGHEKSGLDTLVEINNENYNDIVVKSEKDVVVEFYDEEVFPL